MALEPCRICLEPNQTPISVNLECEDNSTVLQKLQTVAPFHDWLNCDSICQKCKNLLDTSYYFIEMCRRCEENQHELTQKETDVEAKDGHIKWTKLNSENLECTVKEENVDFMTNDLDVQQSDDNMECVTVNVEEPDKNVPIAEDSTDTQKKNDFECSICNQGFSSLLSLEMHSRFVDHGTNCNVCSEVFTDEASLETHIGNDHPGHLSEFTCEVCNETFFSVHSLIRHCEKDHAMEKNKVRPYSCGLCEKRLSTLTTLKRHLRYHEGTRTCTCKFCGKGFIERGDVSKHELIHLNERKYSCELCGKSYNTHSHLRSHKYACHTDPSKWNHGCDLCPKRFPWKAQLRDHIKRHKGIKDFQCIVCPSSFPTKHDLDRHMYFHTKDRPHKCQFCPNKSYRDRKMLTAHMRKCHSVENDEKK